MLKSFITDGELRFGEGRISGYIAVTLAILCFFGALAFHFPQYLTTPELRQVYEVEWLRLLMFWSLIVSGALGLLNFVRNKKKRLGTVAWVFVGITLLLGGPNIEVKDFSQTPFYLGLDWFVLDLLGSALIFILIEKLIPYKAEQPVFRPAWQTDLNHFLVNHLMVGFILLATNAFLHKFFAWAENDSLQQWVTALPFLLQLFLIILAADLIQYWTHRAYHEVPLLWRFHAVHHSAKHMDWLAGSRQHMLEILVTRCLVLTPVYLLGFSKEVIDAYVIIVGFQAVFNHANAEIKFGWLKYIIVTPQFHHWHHASDEAAIDRNYAAHFAFLDYLFGTAVKSEQTWPEEYGVKGDYMPDGFLRQQAFPFIGSTDKKES